MERIAIHLIPGLGKGGAETMLYQLMKYGQDRTLKHRIISLGAAHYYEDPIRALGVEVIELDLRRHPLGTLLGVYRAIRGADSLCCWMYHANMIGYILGRMARVKRLVWFIRHSNLDPDKNKKLTLLINQYCAKKSKRVDCITYNGHQARKVHEACGYCKEKSVVLDNGCDCSEYAAVPDAGEKIRTELGLPLSTRIVLSVTKYSPIKDVHTFVRAFGKLLSQTGDAVAVMCGNGIDERNDALRSLCAENGLKVGENLFLLGLRNDVPTLLSACDLYVLHSAGEAFPNTLLQAMACECVCLSTDVGDASHILGSDECVILPGQYERMAVKMMELLSLSQEKSLVLRKQNRMRVLDKYEISKVIEQYEKVV